MPIPFTKWSARIVTMLVGIIVMTLAIVYEMYPVLGAYPSWIQQILLGVYLGYMGIYVWTVR